MRIQHNIAAINSHRQLTGNNGAVGKNLEKLSSGFRINRAGDDAAGLAISEKMRAQITGLNTASKNAQDGISLVQTAEGALTEVHSMLNRMTELAGQAANGTYQDEVDRENSMKELNSLRAEIDRISQSTNFNGINLLDGSLASGGSIAAKNIKINNAITGETVAVEGAYTASSAVSSTMANTAKDGAKFEFTVTYKDTADSEVKSQTFSLTLKTKEDGTKVLVGAGGKEHSIADFKTSGVQATDIQKALTAELDRSNLSNKFTISSAATTFVARETGSDGAVIVSLSERTTIDGTVTNKSIAVGVTTQAKDAYKTLSSSGITKFDGSNSKNAIFEVNGQKFVLASAGTNISGLGKDVTVLTGTKITSEHAQLISQKTGLNVELGTSAGAGGNAGVSVLIFKPAPGSVGEGGLSLQIGDTSDAFNQLKVSVGNMSAESLGISGLDISTQDNAKAAVKVIKDAINQVSATRGDLGAVQNRLEHTINNLGVTAENMTAAESRIRDVDMAKEMMDFTKNNILTQASQAMLAQANQLPQGVLQLLQ